MLNFRTGEESLRGRRVWGQGCGPGSGGKLTYVFSSGGWRHVSLSPVTAPAARARGRGRRRGAVCGEKLSAVAWLTRQVAERLLRAVTEASVVLAQTGLLSFGRGWGEAGAPRQPRRRLLWVTEAVGGAAQACRLAARPCGAESASEPWARAGGVLWGFPNVTLARAPSFARVAEGQAARGALGPW